MTHKFDPQSVSTEHEIKISRIINAPRKLVWATFTQAEHVAKWFGPRGFRTRLERLDLKVGGRTRYVMIGPDGTEYPSEGTFLEIIPFEKYVSTDEFADDFPGEPIRGIVVTTLFEDLGERTKLTLTIAHQTAESLKQHQEMGVIGGWNSCLDCLDDYLAELTGENPTADREIVIRRVIDAPPELVWDAWTDPVQIAQWWGPDGFTTSTDEIDVRPGGIWRHTMHGPDGRDYPNFVKFREVVAPELLAYTHGDGEDESHDFEVTVTFTRHADGTKLTLRTVFPTAAELERVIREHGALEGGLQHVARLAEHLAGREGSLRERLTIALPSDRQMILRRVFDAPRELVFEAFSKPEHMRRWWGPRIFTMTVCEIDFHPGGKWRIEVASPDGRTHPFRGEYREIVASERIVQTYVYGVDGNDDDPTVETLTFIERDGRTIFTNSILHAEEGACARHPEAEAGTAESMDRLAELLAELVSRT